jgi:hypothetical protein
MRKKDPEKPSLTLVDPTTTGDAPPRKFGRAGLCLWNSITGAYEVDDAGGIELLSQACLASDRLEALGARIDEDGEIIRTRTGVIKAHPCLKEELALRAFICKTLERLGLNLEVVKPIGRPARGFWWAGD